MSKFKSNIALAIIASISFGFAASCAANPIKIHSNKLHRSNYLGSRELETKKAELYHDSKGFMVKIGDEVQEVQNCFIDKELRGLSDEKLQILLGNIKVATIGGEKLSFIRVLIDPTLRSVSSETNAEIVKIISSIPKDAAVRTFTLSSDEQEELSRKLNDSGSYIRINMMSDGEFTLKLMHRLNGGGPICAAIGYWVIKVGCYGAATATAVTAVAATGGAVVAVIGTVAGGAAVGAVTATVGTVVTSTAGTVLGTTGAGAVAGAILGSGLATEAAVVTTVAASSLGSVAVTITAIETTALGFSTWLLFLPIP